MNLVPITCCICSSTVNLMKHSSYSLKDGTVKTQMICRVCNTKRQKSKRRKIVVPIRPTVQFDDIEVIEAPQVVNPITGELVYEE